MSCDTRVLLLGIALAAFAGVSFRLLRDDAKPLTPAAKATGAQDDAMPASVDELGDASTSDKRASDAVTIDKRQAR